MIARATLALGLVWMALPHHPDLGIPIMEPCGRRACITVADTEPQRETIFRRLREVQNEIHNERAGFPAGSSGVSGEAAAQNASGLPRPLARLVGPPDTIVEDRR